MYVGPGFDPEQDFADFGGNTLYGIRQRKGVFDDLFFSLKSCEHPLPHRQQFSTANRNAERFHVRECVRDDLIVQLTAHPLIRSEDYRAEPIV